MTMGDDAPSPLAGLSAPARSDAAHGPFFALGCRALGGGARLFRRAQDRAAAGRRSAAAAVEALSRGVLLGVAGALVLVVVGKFFTRPNRAQGIDPDAIVLDHRL